MMYPEISSYQIGNNSFSFRQNPATREIRGYRFIDGQLDREEGYPLKGKYKTLETDEDPGLSINRLFKSGREPVINKQDEIKWIQADPNLSGLSKSSPDLFSSETASSSSYSSPGDFGNLDLPTASPASPTSLKPLSENPLKKTHPLGFPLGASGTDYYDRHSDWCEKVLSSPKHFNAFYDNLLDECLQKIGLGTSWRQQDSIEEKIWANIIKKIELILSVRELSQQSYISISRAIQEIYENVYQFVFRPVQRFNNLIINPHFFLGYIQTDYHRHLKAHFSEWKDIPFCHIALDILSSQISNDFSKVEKIFKEHPDKKEKLAQLVLMTKFFVQDKRKEFQRCRNEYLCRAHVINCWRPIFRRFPALQIKYNQMMNKRFSSLAEIEHDPQADFGEDPYLGLFAEVIAICEQFIDVQDVEPMHLAQLQQGLNDSAFSRLKVKLNHFRDRVEPLVTLRAILENFNLWPGEYELSKGEKHYFSLVVYQLIVIANKELIGKPFIPYDFHTVSKEAREEANRVINDLRKGPKEKREACRLLFHSQIPWKAILSVASLFHGSGGIEKSVVEANRRLLGEALIDLIADFRRLDLALSELINFELLEFDGVAPISVPQEWREGFYPSIRLLGDKKGVEDNLKKMRSALNSFIGSIDAGDAAGVRKFKYATLRTLQMIGELAKNLRHAGLVASKANFWDCLEELRDVLSHIERPRVKARLEQFLQRDLEGCSIEGISLDLRTLAGCFQIQQSLMSQARNWSQVKEVQSRCAASSHIILEHLQTMLHYLVSDLSVDDQVFLRRGLFSEALVQQRREIHEIKQGFLSGQGRRDQIRLLPLNQKEFENVVKKTSNLKHFYLEHQKGLKTQIPKNIRSILHNKKQLSEATRTALNCVIDNLGADNFAAAKELFTELFKEIGDANAMFQELEDLKLRVEQLSESEEAYQTRIDQEINRMLNSLRTYDGGIVSSKDIVEIIELINNRQVNAERLEVIFKQLGFDFTKPVDEGAARAQKIIEDYKARAEQKGAKTKAAASVPAEGECAFDRDKFKEVLATMIATMEELNSYLLSDIDPIALNRDYPLVLARQYLYSNLRSCAAYLEGRLDQVPVELDLDDLNPLREVRQGLMDIMSRSNDLVHMHTVTEVSTLTSVGKIFVERLHQDAAVRDIPIRPHVDLISLKTKLGWLESRI